MLMSWSGGKDSCLALYEILKAGEPQVTALVTTLTRDYDRISMHGVRRVLLEQQAESLRLPLHQVLIGKDAGNLEYETAFGEALLAHKAKGVEAMAFGDLFLQDIRDYRDALMARHGMTAVYPVWRRDTRRFIRDFLDLGFKAIVTCVDGEALPGEFAGRMIDESFVSDLPARVDPCGENGEFHTFVFDGPIFSRPVLFSVGEVVRRGRFWFCDLTPEQAMTSASALAKGEQDVEP